jgi:uncharacterized protein YutE (UPF0331/DUF86 family)
VNPRPLDIEVVGHRLRILREALDDLEPLRDVKAGQLATEPLTRAAAERLIQVVVDVAVDVNAHIAVAETGAAPTSARESFTKVAAAGAIDADLADRLAPAAGLRNVLVHRYADIRVELVASAVPEVLDGFAAYVRQVADFVTRPSE